MKKHFRKPAIALAAALAAFTFTTGAGLAYAGSSRSGGAYEKCDARKDHSKHSHKKASKEWKKTLSDEQKTQMKELRANLKKELAPLKAQIMAKGAETGKISASDNPDMAAIAKLVDEISALEKKAMLSRYENMIKAQAYGTWPTEGHGLHALHRQVAPRAFKVPLIGEISHWHPVLYSRVLPRTGMKRPSQA